MNLNQQARLSQLISALILLLSTSMASALVQIEFPPTTLPNCIQNALDQNDIVDCQDFGFENIAAENPTVCGQECGPPQERYCADQFDAEATCVEVPSQCQQGIADYLEGDDRPCSVPLPTDEEATTPEAADGSSTTTSSNPATTTTTKSNLTPPPSTTPENDEGTDEETEPPSAPGFAAKPPSAPAAPKQMVTQGVVIPKSQSIALPNNAAPPGGDFELNNQIDNEINFKARDWHLFCCYWAAKGDCTINPGFMLPHCQRSCGSYRCRWEDLASCTINVDSERCPKLPQSLSHSEPRMPGFMETNESQLHPPPSMPVGAPGSPYAGRRRLASRKEPAEDYTYGDFRYPDDIVDYASETVDAQEDDDYYFYGSQRPTFADSLGAPNMPGHAQLPSKMSLLSIAPRIFSAKLSQNTDPVKGAENCKDESRASCRKWSLNGHCEKNPFWMKTRCRRSCSSCSDTYDSIAGVRQTEECHDYHVHCPYWKSIGHCKQKGKYMRAMCPASCDECSWMRKSRRKLSRKGLKKLKKNSKLRKMIKAVLKARKKKN